MLFGLVPALRGTASGLASVLRRGSGTVGRSRSRLAPALVVLQVSLSMLLVTGAGLFVRTLHNLRRVDAGFRHEACCWSTWTGGAPATVAHGSPGCTRN